MLTKSAFFGCLSLKFIVRCLIWICILCLYIGVSRSNEISDEKTRLMECYNIIHENRSSIERQLTQEVKCETYGCVKVAAQFVSFINDTIDPCDDFYQFANGHYINDEFEDIEDDDSHSFFSTASKMVHKKLGPLLSEPVKSNEWKPFGLAKNFFKSCIDQSIIVRRGNQQLTDILHSLGGWPINKGRSWHGHDFRIQFTQLMKKVKTFGFDTDIIFGLDVDVDPKNTTKRLLQIRPGNYVIDEIDNKKALAEYRKTMLRKSSVFIHSINEATTLRLKKEIDKIIAFEIKLIRIASEDDEDGDVDEDESNTDTENDDDVNEDESGTETENVTKTNADRDDDDDYDDDDGDGVASYPISTIKVLQVTYPYLNWLHYISALLPSGLNVTENEPIMNLNPKFFEKLGTILKSTSRHTIANYISWRAIYKSYKMYIHHKGRRNKCIDLTTQRFSVPVGLLYSQKYFNEKSRQAVLDLVEDVRGRFIDMLRNVTWMDDETRKTAIVKANSIVVFVGYPNELYEDTEFNEYYQDLEIEPNDFFHNSLRLSLFDFDQRLKTLRTPVNRSGWKKLLDLDPTEANAFYDATENNIELQVAILHELFFALDRPQYINYATLGYIVGHEITHGFDNTGRKYDLNGTLVDWWNLESKKNFTKRAQCFVNQYNNYIDLQTNLTIDGANTLDENIADNGGTRAAYYAYLNWIERNGLEKLVPGVKYNQKQLFWISYAQVESSVSGVISLKHTIENDEHAPFEFRINGVVSNLEEFASDFNCPVGSKMNPAKKCRIW